ncbi:hypothetical protein IM753_00480 [Moraxella sp. K127]|uniref:hypothetical protein n=1 Tax=Moraxella sp. K127 TaxID=2780079 RepID=UPI00187E79B2|nr:hypothetical protein [Moraxella sp. K127]MBE9589474.1 hypothetical protein [Moraxella sp. K127]
MNQHGHVAVSTDLDLPITPKKRTTYLLVRFGLVLLCGMLSACQHIQWVDSPLPVTLNPNLNPNTPEHTPNLRQKHLPIHPYYDRAMCDDISFAKNPAIKNRLAPKPCTPKEAKRYEKPFFLLEDWF